MADYEIKSTKLVSIKGPLVMADKGLLPNFTSWCLVGLSKLIKIFSFWILWFSNEFKRNRGRLISLDSLDAGGETLQVLVWLALISSDICDRCWRLSFFWFLRPDPSPWGYRNRSFLVAMCCQIVRRPNLGLAIKRLLHQ